MKTPSLNINTLPLCLLFVFCIRFASVISFFEASKRGTGSPFSGVPHSVSSFFEASKGGTGSPFFGSGAFREIVKPGTFRKALESGGRVELKLNHERTLCDTASGLELREDNVGLYAKAEINDRETVEAARAGRLTG